MNAQKSLIAASLLCAVPLSRSLHAALAQEAGWPRTVTHEAGELTLPARPVRIVSTSPGLTGILLAIDAPLVASAATTPSSMTDDKGFFSQWAGVADEHGVEILYRNLNFDIEAVIGWEPDLLIVSASGADSVLQHVSELQAQGLPAFVVNYSNQSWQDMAVKLGAITGLELQAAAAVERFDAHAGEVAASLGKEKGSASIVGYNIGASYSVGRPESPHARLLASLGFDVQGIPPQMAPEVTRRSDFDFISRENLSAAITGDTVFLLRGTDADVEAFLADPVLANLPAVRNGRVYPLGPSSHRIDYYSGREMVDTVARYFR